jgi:hypothetical protein
MDGYGSSDLHRIEGWRSRNLRCGDLKLGYAESKIFVRDGKGGISGHVVVPESLKKHLKVFIGWKENQREGSEGWSKATAAPVIQSTPIYADVTEEDIQNQLKGLWNYVSSGDDAEGIWRGRSWNQKRRLEFPPPPVAARRVSA